MVDEFNQSDIITVKGTVQKITYKNIVPAFKTQIYNFSFIKSTKLHLIFCSDGVFCVIA